MQEARPYKTNVGWRNYVGVSLLIHGATTAVDGVVREISMDGVTVAFPGEETPELHAGDPVTIRLTANWLPRPVVTSASMVGVEHGPEGAAYVLQFSSGRSVAGQITPVLHAIFNRRRTPRAVPNPGEKMQVVFRPRGGAELATTMHQISSTGIAVPAPEGLDRSVGPGTLVDLAFLLPGRSQAVQVVAVLRSRRPDPQLGEVLGFEFDAQATPDFPRLQGGILGYVLSRRPQPLPVPEGSADPGSG